MTAGRIWIFAAAGAAALALSGCASVSNVRDMAWSPCRHDTTVTLYFDTGQDAVTDIGKQIVAARRPGHLAHVADAGAARQQHDGASRRREGQKLPSHHQSHPVRPSKFARRQHRTNPGQPLWKA